MSNAQKIIIFVGVIIIITGLLWPYISKIPFFRLPGDIVVDKPNFKLFIPITSMILFSIILTLLIWFLKKFLN